MSAQLDQRPIRARQGTTIVGSCHKGSFGAEWVAVWSMATQMRDLPVLGSAARGSVPSCFHHRGALRAHPDEE